MRTATLLELQGESLLYKVGWVLKAASKDITRYVLCDRFWLTTRPKFGDDKWIICTDGRRLHAAKVPEILIPDCDCGVYSMLATSKGKILVQFEKDETFPKAWHVVPKLTDNPAKVWVSEKTNNGELFKVFLAIHNKSKVWVNDQFIIEAIKGFKSDNMYCHSTSNIEAVLIVDNEKESEITKLVVVMPLRVEEK